MPRHRLASFFLDEAPADRAAWHAWLAAAPPRLRAASTLGGRRPFVEFAAPFISRDLIDTPRADEIVLYDTDFSQRPRDVVRRRLGFFGSYPYIDSSR